MKKRHLFQKTIGILLIVLLLLMQQVIFAAETRNPKNNETTYKEALFTKDQAEPNNLITKPYKVIVTQTTIRTGPGNSYPSDGIIYKGDIIHVRSISNGWAKFRVNSNWRYVKASHIQKLD